MPVRPDEAYEDWDRGYVMFGVLGMDLNCMAIQGWAQPGLIGAFCYE